MIMQFYVSWMVFENRLVYSPWIWFTLWSGNSEVCACVTMAHMNRCAARWSSRQTVKLEWMTGSCLGFWTHTARRMSSLLPARTHRAVGANSRVLLQGQSDKFQATFLCWADTSAASYAHLLRLWVMPLLRDPPLLRGYTHCFCLSVCLFRACS